VSCLPGSPPACLLDLSPSCWAICNDRKYKDTNYRYITSPFQRAGLHRFSVENGSLSGTFGKPRESSAVPVSEWIKTPVHSPQAAVTDENRTPDGQALGECTFSLSREHAVVRPEAFTVSAWVTATKILICKKGVGLVATCYGRVPRCTTSPLRTESTTSWTRKEAGRKTGRTLRMASLQPPVAVGGLRSAASCFEGIPRNRRPLLPEG